MLSFQRYLTTGIVQKSNNPKITAEGQRHRDTENQKHRDTDKETLNNTPIGVRKHMRAVIIWVLTYILHAFGFEVKGVLIWVDMG